MDDEIYYPGGNLDATPTQGYSWIWYHMEHWLASFILNVIAVVFCVDGLIEDFRKSRVKNNFFKDEASVQKKSWYLWLIVLWLVAVIISLYFIVFINN